MADDTMSKVKVVICDQLNVDESEVTENATFIALEEDFDVSIPDEEVESIRTVGDAAAYIDQHR